MHPYVWIPLLAAVGSALTAGMIYARDPTSRPNRLVAALGACTAFWAVCEVAWNTSDDPARVLFLVRLSALGWIWLGPLSLHTFVAAAEDRLPWAERLILPVYVAAALLLGVVWFTDGTHVAAVRTSWGWGYRTGPAFPAYFVLTLAGFSLGIVAGWRWLRSWAMRCFRSSPASALLRRRLSPASPTRK